MTWCSVSLESLPVSVVGLPMMKVPGSTQIISRSEADATVQVLGGSTEFRAEPDFHGNPSSMFVADSETNPPSEEIADIHNFFP